LNITYRLCFARHRFRPMLLESRDLPSLSTDRGLQCLKKPNCVRRFGIVKTSRYDSPALRISRRLIVPARSRQFGSRVPRLRRGALWSSDDGGRTNTPLSSLKTPRIVRSTMTSWCFMPLPPLTGPKSFTKQKWPSLIRASRQCLNIRAACTVRWFSQILTTTDSKDSREDGSRNLTGAVRRSICTTTSRFADFRPSMAAPARIWLYLFDDDLFKPLRRDKGSGRDRRDFPREPDLVVVGCLALLDERMPGIESIALDELDTVAFDFLDNGDMLIVRIDDLHAFADIHHPPQLAAQR